MSILVITAIIAMPLCLFVVAWRMVRGVPPMHHDRPQDLQPYGALPGLGPIGALGNFSPDADINRAPSNSRDLYGI